jgi:paraquat-inducible protein B
MSEMTPSVNSGNRFSTIWIIPIVALVAGIWMVVHTYLTEGPTISISFQSAEGLEAGKTKVKILNVDIGLIESVILNENVDGVITTVKLNAEARPLLREDTQFWVVRARVGAGGISGLGTILSGAYIELSPGTGKEGQRNFVGLEAPPSTPLDAPGLRVSLYSDHAGSVSRGDSVLYRGYKVGRVESTEFDVDKQQVNYELFIDSPFHEFVHSTTRFWNVSGISLSASVEFR